MSILNYATTLLPSSSPPPPFPRSPSSSFSVQHASALSLFLFPSSPSLPPQRRHRLRRPPLNQVSDYLLEIDFTCSARFCICTSAPVRRTSAIVPDVTGASPFGFASSSSSSSPSSSFSSSSSRCPRPRLHCCSLAVDGIDLGYVVISNRYRTSSRTSA